MPSRRSTSAALRRRQRHELGEGVALLHRLQPGRQVGAARAPRRACWRPGAPACLRAAAPAPSRRPGRSGRPRPRTAPRRRRPATPCTVRLRVRFSAAACWVWKPGVSTNTNCASPTRAHAGDAVPRGLRLARGDADLLPDQRVQQGRLADVRPADDRDQAAARARPASVGDAGASLMRGIGRVRSAAGRPARRSRFSASSMRRAASCSAARRDLPSPGSRQAERRHRALDLEGLGMRLAAGGDDAVGRHRQRAAPAAIPAARSWRPCVQLATSVVVDDLAEQALHQRCAPRRSRRRGRSAPISASSASARIDGALRAAAARLAFAQAQHLGQAELQRGAVQAVLAHQVGAHAGQVAFVGAGEALEQQAGDGQAQDGVAEELEALVVVGAEAAVRQRALQQRRRRRSGGRGVAAGRRGGNPCVTRRRSRGPTSSSGPRT